MKTERTYQGIPFVCGKPDWNTVPTIAIDTLLMPTQAKVKAFAQICYDENALHLRLAAEEAHIRAEMTSPLGQTCEDSCLEFFFRPDPNEMRYFNFEYNLNCCPFVGVGTCVEDLVRLYPSGNPFRPEAARTERGWEVVYSIPYSFIRVFFPGFAPKPGDRMMANFYKCGDKTEIPHYLAWKMPAQRPHAFHSPECFGELVFEPAKD